MFRTSLAAGLVIALSGAASAADASQQYFIVGGTGSAKCSDVTAKVEAQDAEYMNLVGTWVAGYVTAANRLTPDTYNLIGNTQPDAFFGSILEKCKANPDAVLETAVFEAIDGVYAARVVSAPK